MFHVIVNVNSIVQYVIQIKNGIRKHQSQCKNYPKCKKYYSKCICENSKYSKRITDTSVIVCDEIISVMDIASTEMSNTMATNQYIVILKK